MREYRYARRVGAAAILCALVLRLWGSGLPGVLLERLPKPNIPASSPYAETGRDVRFSSSLAAFFPDFVETSPLSPTQPREAPIPVFSRGDSIELYYAADKNPDIQTLLERKLDWQLYGEEPTVLILHTHATESYTKGQENYTETSAWRTLDEHYNMLSIGARVAQLLEEAGIPTVQDRELHDYPSYNGSYTHARKALRSLLEQYPGIRLVLDLHRDASGGEGGQLRTKAVVAGQDSAQLMVVLGTNHEAYEENLSLGLKLHAQLQAQAPGIMRPLQLRSQRFNQDLCPGALLIEVGAAGNSHSEALRAADQLAQAVIALAEGTG